MVGSGVAIFPLDGFRFLWRCLYAQLSKPGTGLVILCGDIECWLCSPHHCARFLFFRSVPGRRHVLLLSSWRNIVTQLFHNVAKHNSDTRSSFTHNSVTYNCFTHNCFTHTTLSCTHNSCTHMHTHTPLSHTTRSYTSLSRTTLAHNRSSSISVIFPAFPISLSHLFEIIGRSWHVGLLSGTLILTSARYSDPSLLAHGPCAGRVLKRHIKLSF